MRTLFLLWAFPVVFFWGWYGLSANDINFGTAILSRHTHDVIFALYGKILGMPAGEVPWALAKIFAFDSLFVLAFAFWRWRKDWYPQTKTWVVKTYHGLQKNADWPGDNNSEITAIVIDQAHPAE